MEIEAKNLIGIFTESIEMERVNRTKRNIGTGVTTVSQVSYVTMTVPCYLLLTLSGSQL